MSVSQAGIYDFQQTDKKRYKPLKQSNTHIQAARNISMPEVSFTLLSLLSRLVYSDSVSCLLYISFKIHIQSTKHFLVYKKISFVCVCVCVCVCVECSTALLHVRQHLWMLTHSLPAI